MRSHAAVLRTAWQLFTSDDSMDTLAAVVLVSAVVLPALVKYRKQQQSDTLRGGF